MTTITMTELRNNLKKYTELAKEEDIFVTKNGIPFVKLTKITDTKKDIIDRLTGCIKLDKTYEEIMEERYSKY